MIVVEIETDGLTLHERQVFNEFPVRKAVAAMAVPMILSQVVFVINNRVN